MCLETVTPKIINPYSISLFPADLLEKRYVEKWIGANPEVKDH